jgi:hypothetical protein
VQLLKIRSFDIMKKMIIVIIFFLFGCSGSDSISPGTTRHFDLRPEQLAQDRYECSKDGADQACIDRGFTTSTTRDGCVTIDNTQYLSGMTCVIE